MSKKVYEEILGFLTNFLLMFGGLLLSIKFPLNPEPLDYLRVFAIMVLCSLVITDLPWMLYEHWLLYRQDRGIPR